MHEPSTIYAIAERPLTTSELQRLAPKAATIEERRGLLRRVRSVSVRWPDVRVTLRVAARAELPARLAGLAELLQAKSPDLFAGLGDRIASVRQVVAVVVEPGLDEDGRVERLLRGVAGTREAIVLRPDGVYDAAGTCLSRFAGS